MHTEEYKPIEQILKDRIGLDPATLGAKGVESAVAERMRRTGIAAPASYAALLSASPEELEALTEAVVIPETWFFRDREPFIFLADFIRSEWKTEHAGENLRILSVPCSTGEEPYSIAMTCLDCGLAANRFSVEAMDINAAFLRKARDAVYGRNSFRGTEPAFRERHFIAEGNHYSLKADIRACVRFFKINILEPEKLPGPGHYNVIFCRNILIYLHDQARARVLAAIDRLLTDDGLLFIGHAEANPFLMEKYDPVKHHGAFAYRKSAKNQPESDRQRRQSFLSSDAYCRGVARRRPAESADSPPLSVGEAGSDKRSPYKDHAPLSADLSAIALAAEEGGDARSEASERASGGKFPDIKLDPFDKNRPIIPSKTPTRQMAADNAADALDHARRLADSGRLKEAAEACSAAINTDKQNASAHFLLGLVKEAQGDNRAAEECFNHAIYLDNNFSDAILHLAVLKEENGDSAGAETLRRRAGPICRPP